MSEFAIAYDVPTLDAALELDRRLGEGPEFAKLGLQLFTAEGPHVVEALRQRGRRVFLDLKLHDIPNTVKGAAQSVSKLGAELLTVHAMGGEAMVKAAVEGCEAGGSGTRVVAVTVLTSLDPVALPPGFDHGRELEAIATELLLQSERAGALGIVCSAADLPGIRSRVGRPFYAVTPGIRMSGGATQDQARVATVGEAVSRGASLLVLGRAVTAADDPAQALAVARAERDAALALRG